MSTDSAMAATTGRTSAARGRPTLVIVGASLSGLRVAEALRARGGDHRIVMIGDELHPPYDRPPLSKGVLTGKLGFSDIHLGGGQLADLGVELHLGRSATALDMAARSVALDDGSSVSYDELVIATGARPRRIPALNGFEGAYTLRTIEDSQALHDAMQKATSVAIVGGGFIGSEVASAGRDLGRDVTVIEALNTPMSRILVPSVGSRLGRLHADAGSELRCGQSVIGADGQGRVECLRLADGSTVEADVVVVGVGSVPNTEWLVDTTLDISDGVLCDSRGRAVGADHVRALGDVARWQSRRFGDAVRTEHWTGAGDQAQTVVADLVGECLPPETLPYVWSDQFGRRIQVCGRSRPDDRVYIIRDDPEAFVAIMGRSEALTAAIAMNDGKKFGALRRLLLQDRSWDEAREVAAALAV